MIDLFLKVPFLLLFVRLTLSFHYNLLMGIKNIELRSIFHFLHYCRKVIS